MIAPVVESDARVTLLGGAGFDPGVLRACLGLAPGLVAADGAARDALAAGLVPDAVIGDFDSLDADTRAWLPADRLHHVPEQDTTDFEKALSRIRAPLVLAVGFTGRRLDHELAVYNALVRCPGRPCIVVGAEDICFLAPPGLALDVAKGTRVSLFPLARVTGRDTGLLWPIEGLVFAPDGRVGTSNVAQGPVTLAFDAPGMLVILPRTELGAAIAGLEQPASG